MRQGEFETRDGQWVKMMYDENGNASEHLKFSEIDNPSNSVDTKLKISQDAWRSIQAWEYVRERYGKGITLSCCYREAEWNKKVGGVSNSLHTTAQAFDCQVGNVSDTDYAKWLRWVECACEKFSMQGELIRYSWGLHIGFKTKLPYTFNGIVYEGDKR